MFIAELNGQRIGPEPGGRAECPSCRAVVIAKCGRIVTHHWAHESAKDCDPWAEPDSEWHCGWQAEVPVDWREIVMGPHRADIVTPRGVILELQHSPLSVPEIEERENFYGPGMRWIFDCREAFEAGRIDLTRKAFGFTFRWRHPRKSIAYCRRPVFLDLGTELLHMQKMHLDRPCHGWGPAIIARERVIQLITDTGPDGQYTMFDPSQRPA